jgi:LVIVD repeat-containing protein
VIASKGDDAVGDHGGSGLWDLGLGPWRYAGTDITGKLQPSSPVGAPMSSRALALGALLLALPFLAIATPVESGGAAPSALTRVANLPMSGANDVALRGGFAYVATFNGLKVVDVSNPAAPALRGGVPCAGKDIGVLDRAGKRWVTLSWQGGADGCPGSSGTSGIRFVDVTNPAAPVVGKQVSLRFGSHTNTPYGDTGYVYNSAYDLLNPENHHRAEIVDARDPANPFVTNEFLFPLTSTGAGCHDIWPDVGRNRAFCTALTETQYWDTTDPVHPVIVSTILNPLITIHHNSALGHGGNWLFIGDEFAGALSSGPCPEVGGHVPLGAVWVYDISVPQAPVPLGYWSPSGGPAVNLCTTHNFNVIEGTDVVVGAAYRVGSYLVDFAVPQFPAVIDRDTPPNAFAWSTYADQQGFAYTGDTNRGFDVYRLN